MSELIFLRFDIAKKHCWFAGNDLQNPWVFDDTTGCA